MCLPICEQLHSLDVWMNFQIENNHRTSLRSVNSLHNNWMFCFLFGLICMNIAFSPYWVQLKLDMCTVSLHCYCSNMYTKNKIIQVCEYFSESRLTCGLATHGSKQKTRTFPYDPLNLKNNFEHPPDFLHLLPCIKIRHCFSCFNKKTSHYWQVAHTHWWFIFISLKNWHGGGSPGSLLHVREHLLPCLGVHPCCHDGSTQWTWVGRQNIGEGW